ncbi:insulin-like growth factor-binding protein complex acid labile subunit [Anthonomus grandis grandis]|uniref:insulin-like growth factor-binding protein complex acid labile subunit n=1 Tax=Anthonomus grandis grandis TaxID=2921223 RepID=UPI00216526B2|nr:insulin-like growth factor-binding protein complex acid labile subunit [Anthonomus grandis grandis]
MDLRSFINLLRILPLLFTLSLAEEPMKCTYGERGSLTATCVNAIPSFFKSTAYKFDHLDETLRCINCNLKVIEPHTFDISGNLIKELDLNRSNIQVLKEKAFMGLIFLQKLNLADNLIETIEPGTFNGTKKIVTLDISGNNIHTLTASGFAELIALEELILHSNRIKTVDPGSFNGLSKLRILDLSSNQFISNLNKSVGDLHTLELLNLHLNSLASLDPNEFFDLINLKELDLSSNQLNEDLVITMTPENTLRRLILDNNNFKTLGFALHNLNALEELDLSHNQIAQANGHLAGHLYNLRILRLDFNNLTIIKTGQFIGFPQLRVLNVSHNAIVDVETTGVFSLQNVHTLDLSYNNISDIDYTILTFRFPALVHLRLEGNVLPCALEKEMEEAFKEDNFKYVLYDSPEHKCVDKSPKRKLYSGEFKSETPDPESTGGTSSTGLHAFIFVLLWIVIIAVGVLYYIQYLFYRGTLAPRPKRVESTVRLISAEGELV